MYQCSNHVHWTEFWHVVGISLFWLCPLYNERQLPEECETISERQRFERDHWFDECFDSFIMDGKCLTFWNPLYNEMQIPECAESLDDVFKQWVLDGIANLRGLEDE